MERASRTVVVECASPFVAIADDDVRAFCQRWDIDELRLVGSAVHGPFRADSDLDFVFYASFRARVYGAAGGPRAEAVAELEALTGRACDLVCPRQTMAAGNPFAVYNLLVEPAYDRYVGLLFYLATALSTLAPLGGGQARAALADPRARRPLVAMLVRLGRAASQDAAWWKDRGLDGFPFDAVRACLGRVVEDVRAQRAPTLPPDEALVALIDAVAPHADAVRAVAAHDLPPPPELPAAVAQKAIGDFPTLRPGAPLPSAEAPQIALVRAHSPAERAAIEAACRQFGVFRLVEALTDAGGPGRVAAFAPVTARLYGGTDRITTEARATFAALGIELVCARRLVLGTRPRVAYNTLVRELFGGDDLEGEAPTPLGLVAEAIADMRAPDRSRWASP